MLKKVGMLGLLLFGASAVMLPNVAFAEDHHPAPRVDYYRVDRDHHDRNYRDRADYRRIEIRSRDNEYPYRVRGTRGISEYRYRTDVHGVHFIPENCR